MRSKSIRTVRRRDRLILDIKIMNIVVFIGTISFFSLSSIIIPKETVSEVEKRELASLPILSVETLFSGNYFKAIENFYNDTFPFRETLIELASNINEARGIREGEEDIKIYKVEN